VFELLVECQPRGTRTDALRGGAASLTLHAALVAGAVIATMQTVARPHDLDRMVPVVFQDPPDRDVPPPLPGVGLPDAGVAPVVLSISAIIPDVIPPPSTAPFDPLNFTGVGPGEGRWNAVPDDTARHGAGAVYPARWVDERPELLGHPAVQYPEILRQAGIGGRAMVEAVIDTTGRAEPGLIRVLSTTHPLFGQPAMEVVAASVYQPGKINGRAVRVRVQVPIDFRVTARGTTMSHIP